MKRESSRRVTVRQRARSTEIAAATRPKAYLVARELTAAGAKFHTSARTPHAWSVPTGVDDAMAALEVAGWRIDMAL